MGRLKEILWALIVTVVCCWIIEKVADFPIKPLDPPEIKLKLDVGGLYFKEIK